MGIYNKRCPGCGYLLSIRGTDHNPEFCMEMQQFPLLTFIPQETRYALADMQYKLSATQRRNAEVMRAIAKAPTRIGIPVNALNPVTPDSVSRYIPAQSL